ncbi:MAG: type IV secretion system DNA-binding domain-containing protein, partial [Anaerolineae bacterium]|nr:type IV secretion system DNA-binding domain-containing protein [Anaerolineae bacterium]
MTTPVDPPQAVALLEDIQQVFDDGNQDDAFDLVNLYLQEHPDDIYAQFLKAEMCLDADRDDKFVGDFVAHLPASVADTERAERLRTRVDTQVQDKLARGRGQLQPRYGERADALKLFRQAVLLAPTDPAVPLSVGMALLQSGDSEGMGDERSPLDFLSSSRRPSSLQPSSSRSTAPRRRPSSRQDSDQIEEYLTMALERSQPGDRPHQEAARHLIRHWLDQQQVKRAFALLDTLPEPGDLAGSVLQAAVRQVVEVAAAMLRADQHDLAGQMLAACSEAAPELPMLYIYCAEGLVKKGHIDEAREAYQLVLGLPDEDVRIESVDAARAAWDLSETAEIECTNCGKQYRAGRERCGFCDTPLGKGELLMDRYDLKRQSKDVIAQVGLAELLAQREQWPDALEHVQVALDALPQRHSAIAKLNELRQTCISNQRKNPTASSQQARDLVNAFRRDGATPHLSGEIRYVCQRNPSAWWALPVQTRLSLVRGLVAGDQLELAHQVMRAAFADNPDRKSVRQLAARLDERTRVHLEESVTQAREALAAERFEQAIHLADAALSLRRDHALARLVRGQARLKVGQDLAALDDFHTVLRVGGPVETVQAARVGAAAALERRWDFAGALDMLHGLDFEEASIIRARLERRRQNVPAVQVRCADQVVMHDTLARSAGVPQYQGYFAVMVRSVGRPWSASRGEWADGILHAGFEFVKVLGGLRNVTGYPVFALRLISEPNTEIAERGRLKVALLVRVSAPDADTCRALAFDLWQTLAGILPAAQRHVYNFEIVTDETELATLLEPFEMVDISEIVRREDVPQQDGDRYAVYPFAPGTLDLHNLCWALLRQKTPAMVSVHLLPTDLMAWEDATMDQMMLGERQTASGRIGEIGSRMDGDPISEWWEGAPRLGQAQANRYLVDYLRSQAYVLRVNVAGSKGTGPLLPEVVAAAMFGSTCPVNNALFGGYEVVRPSTTAEFEIARRNLTDLDVEGWVYSAAPDGALRVRHLMGETEAALAFRLPIPGYEGLPGVPVIDTKPIAPPTGLPQHGTSLGVSVTRVGGVPQQIIQGCDDRRRHTYIVGKTGVGKSTLLGSMALQDIETGAGVCVVDPHGDLVEDILLRIPEHRAADVILFDPSDEARPIGLNLLEANSEPEKHRIVTEFIGLLIRMYDPVQQGIVGPRFQHNVRNAMLTAMALESGTLIEVVRVLSDPGYVKTVLPYVTDPMVRTYWEKQIANTSDFHKSEILDYIVSKFSRFVGDQLVRNIIGQRHTTVDFREVMDKKRILLVNLSKGKIGPESAQFLGLLLVQRLLLTALSRADVSVDQRPDFFLYVDEFQNFATEMFATVLSEGRKYGVAVTVANQYLTQLDHTIREAIFGNVGSIISFRLGTQDAGILAPEMFPVFGPDDLLNLPKFTACVKLLVDGVAARPFTMRTVADTRAPNPVQAEAMRQ